MGRFQPENRDRSILCGSSLPGVGIATKPAADHKGRAEKAIDPALKDLIDNLLVPYLVEEFLRLHLLEATEKRPSLNAISSTNSSQSELDSTP